MTDPRECDTCHKTKPIEAFAETGFAYANRPRWRRHTCRDCAAKAKRKGMTVPQYRKQANLRRLNAQLKAQGKRCCPRCEDTYPLDTNHFYSWSRERRGKLYVEWSECCIDCTCEVTGARLKNRYHSDADYRARQIAAKSAWQRRNPEKHVAAVRRNNRRRIEHKFAAFSSAHLKAA